MTGPMLLLHLKTAPPSIATGILEFVFGGLLFVGLFHTTIRTTNVVICATGKKLSKADVVSLSCKLVSALFAIVSCIIGCTILADCGCISIRLKHNAVKHYMCFGVPYFLYDIYAMYVVFRETAMERNNKACESTNPQALTVLPFVKSRFLLVAHHLLLPLFIFPVFMGGLQSFGGGDCLVAAGFLLEASTPFVSLRKILAILDLKDSALYIVNGAVMTVVFFFCRVVFFPFIYYVYSREHGSSIYETVTHHVPFVCSISMLVLFLPQIYWFGIMVKGGLRVLSGNRRTKAKNA